MSRPPDESLPHRLPVAEHPLTLECAPGPTAGTVRTPDGRVLAVPEGWALLPPGDAMLTRRVKAGGRYWAMSERRGRKQLSRGIWAPAERIEAARTSAAMTRLDPRYAQRLQADATRRDHKQSAYVDEFEAAVGRFLAFAPAHAALADRLAHAIAVHATPVGSGTVARTARIPVAERAEAAAIAWMRHQTTAYDQMVIPREKGLRREVRRMLAARSRALLERYRRGLEVNPAECPLQRALDATR